jgi:hypothetical protein
MFCFPSPTTSGSKMSTVSSMAVWKTAKLVFFSILKWTSFLNYGASQRKQKLWKCRWKSL